MACWAAIRGWTSNGLVSYYCISAVTNIFQTKDLLQLAERHMALRYDFPLVDEPNIIGQKCAHRSKRQNWSQSLLSLLSMFRFVGAEKCSVIL